MDSINFLITGLNYIATFRHRRGRVANPLYLLFSTSRSLAIKRVGLVILGAGLGCKLTGAGLKLGSLAVIRTIAYNVFQKWQSQLAAPIADAGKPITELFGQASEQRGKNDCFAAFNHSATTHLN